MDLVKKEIREALLGDLVPTQDGRLAVSFTRLAKYRNGLGDGYDKVLIFGVMCKRRWYLSAKSEKKMRELAVKGMQDMGRMMHLSSDKDREAVYCSYLLNTPSILTYKRGKDGVIEMTAYSARGISGWIACFRTLNAFQKKVPEVLQRMSEEDEQKKQGEIKEWNATDRLLDKQAKKEKKQEKKRLKKEKRKARMEKIAGVLPKLPELPLTEKTGKSPVSVHRGQDDPEQEIRTGQEASEQLEKIEQEAVKQTGQAATVTTKDEALLDSMRAEQVRLEAEAEQAKLAAKAAQAKLEAAQAKLAAEEAQAKLAEVEARLAGHQVMPAVQQTEAGSRQTEAGAPSGSDNGNKSINKGKNRNGGRNHNGNKKSGKSNRSNGNNSGNGSGNNSGNGSGNSSRNNRGKHKENG